MKLETPIPMDTPILNGCRFVYTVVGYSIFK